MMFQRDNSNTPASQTTGFDLSSSVFGASSQDASRSSEPATGKDIYQIHSESEKVVRDIIKQKRLRLVEQLEAHGSPIEITPDTELSCQKIEGGATYLVRLKHSCGTETCFEISAQDGSERSIGMTYFPITDIASVNPSGFNRTGTSLSVDTLLDLAFG